MQGLQAFGALQLRRRSFGDALRFLYDYFFLCERLPSNPGIGSAPWGVSQWLPLPRFMYDVSWRQLTGLGLDCVCVLDPEP